MLLSYSNLSFAGGDSYQEGKTCYRLGNALERIGKSELAINVMSILVPIKLVLLTGVFLMVFSTTNSIWNVASTTMTKWESVRHTRPLQNHLKGWPMSFAVRTRLSNCHFSSLSLSQQRRCQKCCKVLGDVCECSRECRLARISG